MKHVLKISDGLSLPPDSVTQTFSILAKRRAGKSFTARRFAEQLFYQSQQIVIVDPKGDWWGIRSSADGRSPGLPIVIIGGEHADVPLEVGAGEVIAKLVVEERVSVLLDLSLLRKNEVNTFMTAFLEDLYRLKAREIYRTPMMLIVDEADAIAPQKPMKGEERMLGAMNDIVRRGGQRGIGSAMISQRSAVLNKNVLTQTQMLIVLRTISPQDLEAINAWIDVHGTPEQREILMQSLPALPVGDAWFWSPGWPTDEGIFQREHVLPIDTFDSGATPKPGEKRREPKNLADVDLDALRRQMAATIERAKADDPKLLRAELSKAKAELQRLSNAKPITETRVVEKQIIPDHQMKEFTSAVKLMEQHGKERIAAAEELAASGRELIIKAGEFAQAMSRAANVPKPAPVAMPRTVARPAQRIERNPSSESDVATGDLSKGEKKVLAVVSQYPEGCPETTISVITGYRSTSRYQYLKQLRAKGFVSGIDTLKPTPEGIEALGNDYSPLPTGDELRAYWMEKLSGGEKELFQLLVSIYPREADKEWLQEQSGYKGTSTYQFLKSLKARKVVVDADDDGLVKAAPELFG